MVLLTYNLLCKHILKKGPLHKPGISESSPVSKMWHRHHLFPSHWAQEGKKSGTETSSLHSDGLERKSARNLGVRTKGMGGRILSMDVALGREPAEAGELPLTTASNHGGSVHGSNLFLCFHGRINSKFQGSTKRLPPAHARPKKPLVSSVNAN